VAGYTITLRVSSTPGRAEVLAALEALTWANARWYLDQWDAGKDPPCCTDCAHLRYLPDAPFRNLTFRGGEELLRAGVGSCGELSSLEAGRARAKVMRNGGTVDDAQRAAFVDLELVSQRPNAQGGVETTWHAVVILGSGERVDPSAEKLASASSSARRVGA
jgi:hypothetical protein